PLSLAALDRMRPDLDAMALAGAAPGAGRAALRRRADSRVRVYGAGRVGAQVVALLAAAGVGRIRVFDPEPARPRDLVPGGLTWAEVGMTREAGAARRADPGDAPGRSGERAEGWGRPGARAAVEVLAGGPFLGDGTERPDLVILTPVRPLDMVLVNELMALRIPHLLGSAFEGHGLAGPFVIPGQTACLHCLDLIRRDHDPGWPLVTARLGGYPPGEIACDAAAAASVAAAVTGHALDYLDNHASAVMNGTTDISPDRRWSYRSWAIHAQCRCIRDNPYPLTMVMSAACE
ncbi:ThiF family adenylyltransferase, partial [Nonomuraea sp. MCN248]